jgi:O-methyltransferase involved in polyketide biosynthesis
LGAGFGSRGYRFQQQLRGVRFIDVDSPPTQEYKKQRVRDILGTIPSDVPLRANGLHEEELVAELQKEGYSERHPLDVSRTTILVLLPSLTTDDRVLGCPHKSTEISRILGDIVEAAGTAIC